MTETNVFQLAQPGTFADLLTEVLREGVRALLARAVEAEVAELNSFGTPMCHYRLGGRRHRRMGAKSASF